MKKRNINVIVWRKMKHELYKSYHRSISDLAPNIIQSKNVVLYEYFQQK